MWSPSHPALRRGIQRIPASLLVRFSFLDPASLCGLTRFSTWYPGYTRCLYPKKTAGSTVRATGEHGPCILNLPFLFPQKKREAKRKLPADVRKLKNDCEVRGKRTRRARFAAAVRLAIQLQVLDRYTSAQTSFSHVRPSPPFFFPLSPIGRTGLRALVIPYPDAVIWSFRA